MTEINTIKAALEEAIRRAEGVHGYSCIDKINEALAALSTIDPDAKPQEPSEDAKAFAISIATESFDPWFFNKIEKQYMGAFDHDAAAALITAHDDAIRRECAEKAKWYIQGLDDQSRVSEIIARGVCDKILGTEPAREEYRLASCPHCGTVIMENGYGAHHSASCPLIAVHFDIGTHAPAREESEQAHYWWCPECEQEVDGSRVTFEEHHDTCGCKVVSKQVPAREES